MIRYRPGELDQLIDIVRDTEEIDGMGGQVLTPVVIFNDLWAKVEPMSGTESERFQKLNATSTNKFVIRYLDGILESDRVVWDGTEYNIRSIPTVTSRHMYLEIFAERGVAQ